MKKSASHYQYIVCGAGAAGLFFACQKKVAPGRGILLDPKSPGGKIPVSGGGRGNLTHGGDMKDFVSHYGAAGRSLRKLLYRKGSAALLSFLEEMGIGTVTEEDGRVFPAGMDAQELTERLKQRALANGWEFRKGEVVGILQADGEHFEDEAAGIAQGSGAPRKGEAFGIAQGSGELRKGEAAGIAQGYGGPRYGVDVEADSEISRYWTENLIISSGSPAFTESPSPGRMLEALGELGLEVRPFRQILTPIMTEGYPFSEIAGVSLPSVTVRVREKAGRGETGKIIAERRGGLLFAHSFFSGPAVIDLSRYAEPGRSLEILLADQEISLSPGTGHSVRNFFAKATGLPQSLAGAVAALGGLDPARKAAAVRREELRKAGNLFRSMSFRIAGPGSMRSAMACEGGVSLSEVDGKDLQCRRFPGLYIIGEALDAAGDTGGYNLQLAFSTAALAAEG